MAKGNLFLGTAAKSVGDVVMYRREGSQVSRVRVRKIANPKTAAQCEQRAFMAAVVKFYQPLANVLDRSWQGMSRAKSYAKFLKTNAAIVRAGGYYLPKGTGFFPLPLKLSNGTIAPVSYDFNSESGVFVLNMSGSAGSSISTIGQLSTLFINNGYKTGDVVTIIVVGKDSAGNNIPESIQFIIDDTNTETLASTFPSILFDVTTTTGWKPTISCKSLTIVAGATIVSRNVDGVWQRSTQTVVIDATILATTTSDAAKAAAIASYKGAAASDNPLVYLDGEELDNA